MQFSKFLRIIVVSILLGIVIIGPVVQPIHGDSNATIQINDTETISVSVSFDVDRIVSVSNNTLDVNLFDLVEEAHINDTSNFHEKILQELNQSLTNDNLTLTDLMVTVDTVSKQIQLNYTVEGLVSGYTATQSNLTREFNPITFLFEIVNRSTTVDLSNTFLFDLSWLGNGISGLFTRNYTRNSVNFTYSMNFDSLFNYQPFSTTTFDQWNQTGNTFSANLSYSILGTEYSLLSQITLPPDARGAFAIEEGIVFHIAEPLTTPYYLSFLALGLILIIGGSLAYILTRTREPTKTQPIQEKWRKRRRKRRRK